MPASVPSGLVKVSAWPMEPVAGRTNGGLLTVYVHADLISTPVICYPKFVISWLVEKTGKNRFHDRGIQHSFATTGV